MVLSQETVRSRQLRRVQTIPEHELWSRVRNRQLSGLKFRRQYSIGVYIADFVCIKKKIVIEVDGGQHNSKISRAYDVRRTKYLENEGYSVIRFWNKEIMENIEGVLERTRSFLEQK